MAGFGSFMEGLQGGIGFGQQVREARQIERYRDSAQRAMDNAEAQQAEDYAYYGKGDPADLSTTSLDDPFLYQMTNWFRGRRKKKKQPRTALPAPSSAAPDEAYDPTLEGEPMAFADGGVVSRAAQLAQQIADREATARAAEQFARERATKIGGIERTMSRPQSALPKYEGVGVDKLGGVTAEDGALKKLGKRAKGAAKAAGVGYLAGAATEGALAGYNTDTGDYYDDLGAEQGDVRQLPAGRRAGVAALTDPQFYKDIGVRAAGVMGDVGRAITPDAIEPYLGMRRPARQAQALPISRSPQTPTAAPAAPSAPPAATGATSLRAPSRRAAAPTQALPDPGAADTKIDFADVDPQEVPDFTTDKWAEYRAHAMRSLIRRGMSGPEAFEKVDQQVTMMQQRGFANYAKQGLALQENGNTKGAMAAYRAAFQYFPNGTDVRFGIHKGRIVGYGVNEQTGEPEGNPMVIDPERVAALIDNFEKPGAWQAWAKDRRDSQFKLKEFEEKDKPLAQAQADALRTNAVANANESAAKADYYRAGGAKGGGDGLDGATMRNAERTFRERLLEMGFDDPAAADRLAAIMSQLKVANPQVPDNTIIQKVMERAGYSKQE